MRKKTQAATVPDDMSQKAGPIGAKLTKLLEAKGWTLDDLHAESGVARTTIATLKSGARQSVTTRTLERLARALGVKVSDLTEQAEQSFSIEPYIKAFLADPIGRATRATEKELDRLRESPVTMWDVWTPTPHRLHLLILSLRAEQSEE